MVKTVQVLSQHVGEGWNWSLHGDSPCEKFVHTEILTKPLSNARGGSEFNQGQKLYLKAMMKTEQLNTSPTKQNTPPLCTMEKQDQRHFLYSHSGQE